LIAVGSVLLRLRLQLLRLRLQLRLRLRLTGSLGAPRSSSTASAAGSA
jgi:hypothetical protein